MANSLKESNGRPTSAGLSEEEEGYMQIWNATFAFATPMVIKAAILLGIPDVLDAKGALTLEEIAEETSAKNTDALFRILRFLVANKIFSSTENSDPNTGEVIRRYGLTSASKWLVNKDKTLAPYILLVLDEAVQAPWHHYHESVLEKDGRTVNSFTRAKGKSIYDYSLDHPSFLEMFNKGMAARSNACIDTIVKHKDVFQGLASIVDVGGGIGLVTNAIVNAFPHIKGTNFDRPSVIATAPPFPGVEHVGGDMFVEVPSADAILCKMVLHGYDDKTCIKLLKNFYKALPQHGKLIVIDFMLNPLSPTGYACDMLMGVTSTSGRDRTQCEWTSLLRTTSFDDFKFHLMFKGSICIIEAFKISD